MPFVMDYKFLIKHGFISIMSLDKYELMYLSLDSQAVQPSFTIKEMTCEEGGLVLYYSHQCPFTAKYAPMIEAYCQEKGLIIKLKLLNSSEEAKMREFFLPHIVCFIIINLLQEKFYRLKI